jgi:hypothetical protein
MAIEAKILMKAKALEAQKQKRAEARLKEKIFDEKPQQHKRQLLTNSYAISDKTKNQKVVQIFMPF